MVYWPAQAGRRPIRGRTLTIALASEGVPVPGGGARARVRVAHLGFFHG